MNHKTGKRKKAYFGGAKTDLQIQIIYSKFKGDFIPPRGTELQLAKFVFLDRLISDQKRQKGFKKRFSTSYLKVTWPNPWIFHNEVSS